MGLERAIDRLGGSVAVVLAGALGVACLLFPEEAGLFIVGGMALVFQAGALPLVALWAWTTFAPLLSLSPTLFYLVSVALGVAEVFVLAKSLSIPLDLPAAGKAIGGIFRRLSAGQSSMTPAPSIKFQLRRPEFGAMDGMGGMEMGMGMGMGGEEVVITADLIAVLLGGVGGIASTVSLALAAGCAMLALLVLQYQERQPISWGALLAGVAWLATPQLGYWLAGVGVVALAAYPPTKSEEPEPLPVPLEPEEPPDPADEWAREVMARLEDMVARLYPPDSGQDVRVVHLGRQGLQEVFSLDIGGIPASQSALKQVQQAFGDLEFSVGRVNIGGVSRLSLLIVNPHIKPPAVGEAEFVEATKQVPDGYLLVGFTQFGEPVMIDLEAFPHGGFWGSSGTGKSVTMRSAVIGATLAKSPEEIGLFVTDPKAVTFSALDYAAIYANVISPFGIACAVIFMLEEARRRMRLMAAAGVEKFVEFNALMKERGQPPLARILLVMEELEFLQQQTAESAIGSAKKPGVLTPFLFADDSPYTPEEREVLAGLLPQSFFSVRTLWEVIISATRQLAAVARACGVNLLLCTQTPKAEIVPATLRGNLSYNVAHYMPESAAGVMRALLGGDRDIMPWNIPRGVKGMFVCYQGSTHEVGRGVYLPPQRAAELTAGFQRERMGLIILADPSVVSPEAVGRYRRIDEFVLGRRVAEGTLTQEAMMETLRRWYDGDTIRALSSPVTLPLGLLIDTALRVPMSI